LKTHFKNCPPGSFVSGSDETPELECEDWVTAAKWTSADEVLALTAHNRILRLAVRGFGLSPASEVVHCREKCILYSGQVVDDDSDDAAATVLAGTVFSELVIW
jgi:hypothetical protein